MATTLLLLMTCAACSLPNPFSHTVDNAGRILFGFGFHRVSAYQIEVMRSRDTFFPGQSIAWVAYLNQPARGPSLTISIRSLRTRGVVLSKSVAITNPKFNVLADSEPVRALQMLNVKAPGRYLLRYSRGSKVLAEGTFRLGR